MNKETQQNIHHDITETVKSKKFKILIRTLAVLVVACALFQAGVFVGFHKASYGSAWHDNYYKNFGSARRGPMVALKGMPENFPNAHGAIGKIITADYPTIIVEDRDETEKVILLTDKTEIRKQRDRGDQNDLKVDTFIVVIGSPNDNGQVEAKLIRILPAPPENRDTLFIQSSSHQ